MPKTKQDRIEERQKDIAAAKQRIEQEEAKISSAKARINSEKKRIRGWQDEICRYEEELLAEKFRASNISLEDALAAIELQSDQQSSSTEE